MSLPFTSHEEANDRLHQSVIFYNGKPVYIHSVIGDNIMCYHLPMKVAGHVMLRWQDPGFDSQSLRLGYMNSQGVTPKPDAYYVTRMPVRQWRQGLVGATLELPEWEPWTTMLSRDYLCDMLVGKYPSYDEAIAMLEKSAGYQTAFHQKFAITYGKAGAHYLSYRGKKCASTLDGRHFKLGVDYQHLREQLQELGIQLI